ncbi:MAG: Nif3-like dinuclear metal center hexameric protein [Verrucomicrobia bacterium]|nr:MAG: Nif3-like dinuclear metal center hexameric protein [Verrucomicrobiota bacterium]
MSATTDIAEYADEYLRISQIEDWPNALNGLQLENSGTVTKIAAAVDVSTRALEAAAEAGANLLIVHHGMFWPGLRPVTKALHRQLKTALDHDIAIYSAHLPLDLHPEVGNNILLIRALGIENSEPFFEEKGSLAGRRAAVNILASELAARLERAVGGPVKQIAVGPKIAGRVGVITGAAGSEIERVAAEGIETFITGEAPHWAAVAAEELGINLLLGGHYATETFGVKALAARLSERFRIPYTFIDCPTGL